MYNVLFLCCLKALSCIHGMKILSCTTCYGRNSLFLKSHVLWQKPYIVAVICVFLSMLVLFCICTDKEVQFLYCSVVSIEIHLCTAHWPVIPIG